ncbi:MAG: tetratricopeptide repeat protein [Desulfarculus sp.]|nr:tetratricopeptide repeat protein [Desulfarculus sp.]
MAPSKLIGIALAYLLLTVLCAPAWAAAPSPAAAILAGNRAAEKGDLDGAIKHFSAAIDSGKLSKENLAIAYNNRGSAYDDKSATDKAIKDFSKAIQLNPRYDAPYFNRSHAYERKGMITEAYADMEKAAQLEPDDQDFQQRLTYLKSRMSSAN